MVRSRTHRATRTAYAAAVVALALYEVRSAEVDSLTEHDERQRASSVSLSTERYPIVEIRGRELYSRGRNILSSYISQFTEHSDLQVILVAF